MTPPWLLDREPISKPSEMLKTLRFLIPLTVALLYSVILQGQCTIESEWSFTPPPPPGGVYDEGTVVTICSQITAYQSGGTNWISGMVLVLPDAWDQNTISNITGPSAPCNSFGGEWIFLPSLNCNGFDIQNPGFYFDNASGGGPQDGDPCNNWGDGLTPCDEWEICFDITLDADCGGITNPFDGENVTPFVRVYSDSEIGSWTVGTGCSGADFEDPPAIEISIDCCDAEPGTPPANPINICGNTPFDLFALLGGPVDLGGTWSGPAGWTAPAPGVESPATFTPSTDINLTDPPGEYTYSVVGTDGCINTSTITIELIDLGLQSIGSVCTNTPVSLFDEWNNPSIALPAGGEWYFEYGTASEMIVPGGIVDPAIFTSGIYTYIYTDASNCITLLSMTFSIAPGGPMGFPSNEFDVCVLDDPFFPWDSLLGIPAALNGDWLYYDTNGNIIQTYTDPIAYPTPLLVEIDPSNYDGLGTAMESGFLVYFGLSACGFSQDTLAINVSEVFNAGEFTQATICDNTPPLLLESLLDGTPDADGDWIDAATSLPVPNPFDPSTVTADQTYTYIYSGGLSGTFCAGSQVLELNVLSNFINAGTPTTITVCALDPIFSMFDELNGNPQPGGEWTDPSGDVVSEFFDPATDPSGIYTYTITSPCGSESNTLTITVNPAGNAGIDGNLEICPTETNIPLANGLIGTPDLGGFWTLSGNVVGATVDGNAVNDGDVYTYSVGIGACLATAQVTIDLQEEPDAGVLVGLPQTYCADDPSFSLHTLFTTAPIPLIEGWTDPTGTAIPSTINPATAATGTYTYTATTVCGTAQSTVFLSFEPAVNAGTSTTINVCENATLPVPLIIQLGFGITAGGTWTNPMGNASNGIFNPGDPAGIYTYTVSSMPSGACTDVATVTVQYTPVANAGINTTIEICDNAGLTFLTEDLLDGNADAGGTWSPYSAYLPGVSTPNFTTYEIINPGCDPSSAVLTINEVASPNAGLDASVTQCSTNGNIFLFDQLSGTPVGGGTWVNTTTGAVVPNLFNVTNECGNTFTFEYTVDAGSCQSTSTLNLAVECPPEAGPPVTANFCADNSTLDLLSILDPGADLGGNFEFQATGMAVPGNEIVLTQAAAGVYTYVLDPGVDCSGDFATYTINIDSEISVTADAQCTPAQTDYQVTLTISGGTPPYTITGLPGAPAGPIVGNTFTSDEIPTGTTYSYTVSDSGPCTDISAGPIPSPNCACPATAEFVETQIDICEGGTANITLNFPSGQPQFSIQYDDGTTNFLETNLSNGSVISVSPTVTTVYTLTQVTDNNCFATVNDQVLVTVEALPDAGPDLNFDYCGTGGLVLLDGLLDPAADQPGTFEDPIGMATTGFTQVAASSGTYIYTVEGTQCPDDQALYDINIVEPLTVTSVSADCNAAQTDYQVTLNISGGTPPYTITGLPGAPAGPIVGDTFISDEIPTGTTYNYTVSDNGPCADISAGPIPSPNCACPATAEFVETQIDICEGGTANITLNFPSGQPQFSIDYNDGTTNFPETNLSNGSVISVSPAVTTVYTLTQVTDANCMTTASDQVIVNVEALPNAGPDLSFDFCGTGGFVPFIGLLDPSADQPGIFGDPTGMATTGFTQEAASSGTYTYTVEGTLCPDDQAFYNITIVDPLAVSADPQCNAAQTDYQVTLNISGGTPPYTITGLPGAPAGPIVGNTFTSDEIPTGTTYSYAVSDNGPCTDISSGPIPSPNCACPATAEFVETQIDICEGGTADITLNFPSGQPQFSIQYGDGTTIFTENNLSNGSVISVSPTVTTTYTLTQVSDANCMTTASDQVLVTVENLPNAGPNVNEAFCATNSTFNLFNLVDLATADANGEFYDDENNIVAGDQITLNSSSTGNYTYEVNGTACPTDVANYFLDISDPITIESELVDCIADQTGYIVSFDISSGDGNYTVTPDDVAYAGTLTQGATTSYESGIIANDVNYGFTIADGSPCPNVVVQGIDPDCDCPATASILGTTSICGDGTEGATLTFILDGDGPWNVVYENSSNPGVPIPLDGIENGHIVNVNPIATSTYTITSVQDMNCTGTVIGQPAIVTVDPVLSVSPAAEICDNNGENYSVEFSISGGIPGTYQVSPFGSGVINGADFTSNFIASGTPYSFTVSDFGACPDLNVNGVFQCPCISEAGTITAGSIEVCANENIIVPFNNNSVLDGNDGYQFILHDGDENTIGFEFARFDSNIFTAPDEIQFGTTYYITGVAGTVDVFGNVQLGDNCTDQTNGVPVVINEVPNGVLSGNGAVCPGEEVELMFSFTGSGPWDLIYSIDNVDQAPITTSENPFVLNTSNTGVYEISTISDNNCVGTANGIVEVSNFAMPTAILGGNPDVCENSNDGPEVTLTGTAPWTVFYSIDGNNAASPITTSNNQFTIAAEEEGVYQIVALNDANCTGTASGSLDVNIIPSPSGSISGGGTVCEGDELPFQVNLTGTGPWNFVYAIDGVTQPNLSSATNVFTFNSGVNGDYTIALVNDQNCQGLGDGSVAILDVNALPTVDIISNSDQLCIGQELELIYDLQGTPPFNFTYVLDDDTVNVDGVESDFFLNANPVEPVFTEVLFIEDGSNPVCFNQPDASMFVAVGTLPDAPILFSDTICMGTDSVLIGVNGVSGLDYTWSPEDRLSDPKSPNPAFILSEEDLFPGVRTYTYTLIASNGECSAEDQLTITVDPGPRARFRYTPDPVNSEDTKVGFINQSSLGDDGFYFWQFDSLETSQEVNPFFEFPSGTIDDYTVSLMAIDPITGCTDEYVDVISVRPEILVYVPSAFTPDGDGLNDIWKPIMTNVDEEDYRLTVFDRSGKIVFETRDTTKGWNGSHNNGEFFLKSEVYAWKIETKNPLSLEEVEYEGVVTVIR